MCVAPRACLSARPSSCLFLICVPIHTSLCTYYVIQTSYIHYINKRRRLIENECTRMFFLHHDTFYFSTSYKYMYRPFFVYIYDTHRYTCASAPDLCRYLCGCPCAFVFPSVCGRVHACRSLRTCHCMYAPVFLARGGSQSVGSCHHKMNFTSLHCNFSQGSTEIGNEPPVLQPCLGGVVNESLWLPTCDVLASSADGKDTASVPHHFYKYNDGTTRWELQELIVGYTHDSRDRARRPCQVTEDNKFNLEVFCLALGLDLHKMVERSRSMVRATRVDDVLDMPCPNQKARDVLTISTLGLLTVQIAGRS